MYFFLIGWIICQWFHLVNLSFSWQNYLCHFLLILMSLQMHFAGDLVRKWSEYSSYFDNFYALANVFFHIGSIVCQWFHHANLSFWWQNYLYDCQSIVLNGESYYCGISDEGKKVWQPCRQMRQIYLRLFQRKLLSAGCPYMDISQFHKTLQKVKIFARFMESFTDWLSYGCQATPPFWKRLSAFEWKMLRRAFPQTDNLGRIW